MDRDIHESRRDAAFHGQLDRVKALIAAGADVDAEAGDESTPLIHAALNGHLEVCKVLVAAGACMDSTDNSSKTPQDYAELRGHTETRNWLEAAEEAEDQGCLDWFLNAKAEALAL